MMDTVRLVERHGGNRWNDDGFDSTFVFDAEVALDGVIEVSILSDMVSDQAGNGNNASDPFEVAYNGIALPYHKTLLRLRRSTGYAIMEPEH